MPSSKAATAADITHQDPTALAKSAQAAMQAKDWSQALGLWDRYLALKPDDAYGYRMRGLSLLELGRNEEALAAYQKYNELAPNDSKSWNDLCWANILINKPQDARPDCYKAVELDSSNYNALVNIGHTYLLQGDSKTAQEWYRKTLLYVTSEAQLKDGPLADFDIFIGKGWQMQASRQAKAWFEKEGSAWLARWVPVNELLGQANAAQEQKDYARAVTLREQRLPLLTALLGEEHQRVKDANKALIDTRDQLADQLFAQANYAQALLLYQQVLAFRQKDSGLDSTQTAVSLNDVARTLENMGSYLDALPLYTRALAISEKQNGPEHPSTGASLNNLAGLYKSMGQYARAEPLYTRALAISEKAQGPDHPSTGIRLNNLAHLYNAMGQYARAEPLYTRALAISEKQNGPEQPSTGTHLNNLAGLYESMGQYARAEPLYTRALAISEKQEGPEHPSTGIRLNNLAGLYVAMGQYTRAEPLLTRALAISDKQNGPEHPSTGTSLNNLAGLYESMGEYARAEPLYTRALAFSEKQNGPEHPGTGTHLNNLASLYQSMGEYARAEPLYTRALAISEKQNGPEHPGTGTRLNNLASLYQSMGQYARAEPMFTRALAISEKQNGPEHPGTGTRLNNLASLYQSMGQYARAEPMFTRALAISEKQNGPEHPGTGTRLNNLASLYQSMGQYARAEPMFTRALAISEKQNGPEHPGTGTRLNNLASLYQSMGQYARAEPMFTRALAISEKQEGPEHPSTGTRLNNLAHLYESMGQYARAEPMFTRALAISEKQNGPEHPTTGASLNNLALLYKLMGQYARAELLFTRALAISEKQNGPEHPNTGARLNNLAALYSAMGQYARAEPLFTRALAISEKQEGPEHPGTGTRLNNLASLYQSMGQYARAESLFTRALVISEKQNGPEHPTTGASLNNLAALYSAMGQYARAEPLFTRALPISEKQEGPEHPNTGVRQNNLASLYELMGQYARAEPLFTRALTISEKQNGPEHPDTGTHLNNLAGLYQSMGQYARAEPLFTRAWRIASKAGKPELAWSVQGKLRSFYADTKPDLAIWYGKQAVNTLQTVRSGNTALDKDTQKSFLQKNESTYKSLADLLFAQGRLLEGQQVLAMLKEAEYFDFVQRSSSADPRTTQVGCTAKEQVWCERYIQISAQLTSMGQEFDALQKQDVASLSPAQATRKATLDADLTVAKQAYDAFTVELLRELGQQGGQAASDSRQREVGSKQLENLSTLQGTLETLGHGAVTLHYLMTDKRLWILLTTPTVQLKREAAISEKQLNLQIGQYRDAIASRSSNIKELGKALYDVLIAPVAKDLEQEKAQTLMLSLDGSLRYLPMAALFDGEKFLAQRYRLALFTEAAKDKLKDAAKAQWRFAGFGLTETRGNFVALPSVRGELEGMVAPGFAGDIKFDKDFTAASFKDGLGRRPPVVHIASHFVFKSGTEADSYLLLGDGSKLSLQAIKQGNYKFTDVDLVTLSACETAVGGGKDANGREVEGFGALAQNQGAKGVIATLWPVADQSTGQFMQLFYGYRQNNPGMTKAQAMQMAQNAFIEGKVQTSLAQVRRSAQPVGNGTTAATAVTTTDHPYYWAPFILMGNWL